MTTAVYILVLIIVFVNYEAHNLNYKQGFRNSAAAKFHSHSASAKCITCKSSNVIRTGKLFEDSWYEQVFN